MDRRDLVGVPRERPQQGPRGEVPDPDGPVLAPGDDDSTLGEIRRWITLEESWQELITADRR